MKVLMVGFVRIGEDNATGRTLKNLFEGMENVSVLQYCLNPRLRRIENPYPTVYLSQKESPFNYYVFEKHGGMNTDASAAAKTAKKGLKSKIRKTVSHLASLARDACSINVSEETYKSIDEFSPDVIYTLGGSIGANETAVKLSKHYGIPIVAHAMDDLVAIRYSGKGLFDRYLSKRFMKSNREMYKHSVCAIAIGEKMEREYEKTFGLPFCNAMNCIEKTHYTPREPHDELRLIFSGGVHGGRDRMLAEFAKSIDKYNSETAKKTVKLEIYTNPAGKIALSDAVSENVSLHDYVPMESYFENLSRADILLHVESFDEKDKKYFRLSMSTKLPEYMSVGRAVMVIGPEDVSSVEYVKNNGIGFAFHGIEGVKGFFDGLDDQLLEETGKKALALAEKNHLRINVQKVLTDAFEKSVKEYKK